MRLYIGTTGALQFNLITFVFLFQVLSSGKIMQKIIQCTYFSFITFLLPDGCNPGSSSSSISVELYRGEQIRTIPVRMIQLHVNYTSLRHLDSVSHTM